jgi:cytochrome c peroxidase
VRGLIPSRIRAVLLGGLAVTLSACGSPPPWEAENPLQSIPPAPLGSDVDLASLPMPPTPERVRLGRWLFYDTRLSADGTVSCGTCHRPEHAFSEPTPVSSGIGGQKGRRKAPALINRAANLYPHFFWDGRAASLEEQMLGPLENPVEMGSTREAMVKTLSAIPGYRAYFTAAFGTGDVTVERVAQAITDYERTRLSGNSPYDRWRRSRDQAAVSPSVKLGHELFYGKAGCSQCHVGSRFTDTTFHNIGIGWEAATKSFKDDGRYEFTAGKSEAGEADRGAFKTPTLRDVSAHAPYMHDGSIATLREVVEYYNRGANRNSYLDPKIEPLGLTAVEVDALVAMLEALDGEGYQDTPPTSFPR